MTFFIHRDCLVSKQALSRLHSFAAAPVQGGCAAALGIRTCGDAVNLSRINVNHLNFAPKGAICHARKDQFL
jgi:hypothetical protein